MATNTELQQICGLFLACRGQYGRFLYSCPEDNSRQNGPIGLGGGGVTTFPIQRFWGPQAAGEYVLLDTSQTWRVYVNNVLDTANWTVTDGNSTITRNSPPDPGAFITMDYYFHYLCRFLEDINDFEQFYYHMWTLKSLKFRSIKLTPISSPFRFPNPSPIFPDVQPGLPVKMKPTFSHSVTTCVSGAEILMARQIFPIWDFELTFELIRDDTQNVITTLPPPPPPGGNPPSIGISSVGYVLEEDEPDEYIVREPASGGGRIEREQ